MAVDYIIETFSLTQRRACRVLSIHRAAYRYEAVIRSDEDEVRAEIIELASNFGRAGYRQVARMMRNGGRRINEKRVERIWREEGLQVPAKQSRKRRLWLTDGSCIRLRPEHENHVWSYDFVEDRTMDGRKIRFLNIIEEHGRKCLASIPKRMWRSHDVIEALADLILTKGAPEYLRSDNGSEFTAKVIREWLSSVGVITTYIEPGSPWENGYCESFNARMRDEFLNGELFGNLYEATILTRRWVDHYNTVRPHSSLGGRPPAPQAVLPDFVLNRPLRD